MPRLTPDQLVQLAWDALPRRHKQLLESIGASSWGIVAEPLGLVAADLSRSAGQPVPPRREVEAIDDALGIWIRELRVVLINAAHPQLTGIDDGTYEELVTWVAWHEWGHALSVTSRQPHDPGEGARLLDAAPAGMSGRIRRGNYPRHEYIHELIAETYALLMRESVEGRPGRPPWLSIEIYNLMTRIGA